MTKSNTSHWDVQGGSQRVGLGNSLTVDFFLLGRISKSKFLRKMQVLFIIYFKSRSCRICKKNSLWKRDELVHYIEGTNYRNELSLPLYVDIIHFFSESECSMSLIWNHWLLAKKLWKMRRFFQSWKDAFSSWSSQSSTAHCVPLNHSLWTKSWKKNIFHSTYSSKKCT